VIQLFLASLSHLIFGSFPLLLVPDIFFLFQPLAAHFLGHSLSVYQVIYTTNLPLFHHFLFLKQCLMLFLPDSELFIPTLGFSLKWVVHQALAHYLAQFKFSSYFISMHFVF
jgi:hypothetical protein